MSATFVETRPIDADWISWLKRELAPTPLREIRTAILVAGPVLCVIISMALQVPELAVSAYMVFFFSQKTKTLTARAGVVGLIGLTISIGATLLLYKFTYGHPELRIPAIAIAVFLGMWLSRVFVIGVLGFLVGFVVAYSQSIAEQVPSPELIVRGALWLWVAIAYSVGLTVVLNRVFLPDDSAPEKDRPKPKSLFKPDAFTNPAHVQVRAQSHFRRDVLLPSLYGHRLDWDPHGVHHRHFHRAGEHRGDAL
jgi:hypothetical protein